MTSKPLNFINADDRDKWILEHAQYFTTSRFIDRKLEREQHASLDAARQHANKLLKANPKAVLIYAVHDESSAYIETIR